MNIWEMPSTLVGLLGSGPEFEFSANLRIELTEDLDPAYLAQAVEKARERYPYFYVRMTTDEEGEPAIEDNPAPVVIRRGQEPPLLMSEECNGHIMAICYEGAVLWFCIHHAFTDGTGLSRYLQTVFYLYATEKYGLALDPTGIRLPGEPVLPAETDDPNASAASPAASGTKVLTPRGYGWHSAYTEEKKPTGFLFTIPEEVFVRYAKEQGGSPAVMPIAFMVKAIYAIHEDQRPINAMTLVDHRAAMGCPDFMGSCASPLFVTVPAEAREWDMKKLASELRAAVLAQAQTMVSPISEKAAPSPKAPSAKAPRLSAADKKALKAISRACIVGAEEDSSMTIACSYPGPIRLGKMDRLVKSVYNTVHPGAINNTFQFSVNAVSGNFYLVLNQRFASDVYAKQFAKELEKEGVPCTMSKIEPFFYAKTPDIQV